jgi:hypothetical protein
MSRHQASTPQLSYCRAAETFEFEGAFRCLYASYHKRGLAPRINHEMRVTRYHLLPTTSVFVARRGKEIVGTLSMVEDSPLGVPMRVVFDRQIDELAGRRASIVEATCLAVRGTGGSDVEVVHRLMGLLAQSAYRRNIERVVIAVHPRHVAFYERSAAFRVFAPSTPYPSVGGKLAVGMELNLMTLQVRNADVWQKYFVDYQYPESAVSLYQVPQSHLQRIAAHWRAIYDTADELGEDRNAAA